MLHDAVMMQFIIIGEAIVNVETGILAKYDYPWYKVKSFRNMIAHAYFNIKLPAVWQIIENDLHQLRCSTNHTYKRILMMPTLQFKGKTFVLPRLKLLNELLHTEGVILVSIDDHEASKLKLLMDEVFGEENFIAQLVWEKGRKNDAKLFSIGHEYIIAHASSKEALRQKKITWREEKPGAKEIQAEYLSLREKYGSNDTAVENGIREFYKSLPKGHLAKKHSGYGNVDGKGVWQDDNLSWSGGETPKDHEVLKRLIRYVTSSDNNCTIPDSFAGSATTAHAVLELNKEDGGNRKFILIEQEDYANTITAERVRRVINGVKTAKNENLNNGLVGTFSYFELGANY